MRDMRCFDDGRGRGRGRAQKMPSGRERKLDTNKYLSNLDTNIRDFFQSDGTRPSVVIQRHFSPSSIVSRWLGRVKKIFRSAAFCHTRYNQTMALRSAAATLFKRTVLAAAPQVRFKYDFIEWP